MRARLLVMRTGTFALGVALSLMLTLSAALAQNGYQIRSGDTLQIEVQEDPSLSRSVLVLPDGSINFPLVGTVQAGGRSVASVQSAIASGLAPNFAVAPTVFVSVGALAERRPRGGTNRQPRKTTISTYIMGEIASPGKVEVDPGTTLLQLLAQAGGLTRFAADQRIQLRRTDYKTGIVRTYLFSFYGRGKGVRISGSTILAPGDVVIVPERRLFE